MNPPKYLHVGLCIGSGIQKRYEEAERLFTEVLNSRSHKLGDDNPETLEYKNGPAVLYKEQELYDKSEKLLLETFNGRRLKPGDTHPHTLESWNNLIELYKAWDKPKKADEWRSKPPKTEAVEK